MQEGIALLIPIVHLCSACENPFQFGRIVLYNDLMYIQGFTTILLA